MTANKSTLQSDDIATTDKSLPQDPSDPDKPLDRLRMLAAELSCSVSIEVAQSTPGIKKQPPPLSVVRFPDAIPGSAPCGGAGLGTA